MAMYRVHFFPNVVHVPSNRTGHNNRASIGDMQMFTTQSTTDRTDNNNFVTNNGATVMLYKSISTHNRIKTLAAAIAVTAIALFSTATPASADTAGPVPGFTPDGVNFIPAAGFDGQVIARFTPDGVNQVETPEGPAIVRAQVLAYLNGGNHSPDGVSNLQNNGQTSPVIAMFTPDGVNQIETVDGPATARQQVLAYLNGGNHSPDGVSNLQDEAQGDASVPTLAYYYAGKTDASQVG